MAIVSFISFNRHVPKKGTLPLTQIKLGSEYQSEEYEDIFK